MTVDSGRALISGSYALVLAGGRGTRLGPLTDHRAKPAVPFGGSLRIIDFALCNCVNSGLRRIAVLTQYKAQSLIRHVERTWGFLEASLGEYVDVVPAQQQLGDGWYCGTADAVFQNLDLLREVRPRFTLILGGDHVYKMDYAVMLADHVDSGADVTVACIDVPAEEAHGFGVVAIDARSRIVGFQEKPRNPVPLPDRPGRVLASMGIYVFGTDCLIEQLERDARDAGSSHDFGQDLLPAMLARGHVHAHRFESSCVNMAHHHPYWRDVGTLDAYWEANMDLTQEAPELDLYDTQWPMPIRQLHRPPAKFLLDDHGRRGVAIDSLVAGGCIVSGATVHRSVLFRDVRIAEGSRIDDSVVLPNARIGRRVRLHRTVIDKRCVLPDGFCAGLDPVLDRQRFHVSPHGITLVTADMLHGGYAAPH